MTQPSTVWSLNTPLYKLVASRLGTQPIDLIVDERAKEPPTPYAKIAELIRMRCNQDHKPMDWVELTHEAPRRWHLRYLESVGEAATPA